MPSCHRTPITSYSSDQLHWLPFCGNVIQSHAHLGKDSLRGNPMAAVMEVRWRLFARDIRTLLTPTGGGYSEDFACGSPSRPVRGVRLLGVVVHRSESRVEQEVSVVSAAADNGALGILGIDDGTGVVEVRLPLALWGTVALWDQVDVVGRPVRGSAGVPVVLADGCHVETDPNVATLRALECIKLYKRCYFSRDWSPSAIPLPAIQPDPWDGKTAHASTNPVNAHTAQAERLRYSANAQVGSSGQHQGPMDPDESSVGKSECEAQAGSRDGMGAESGTSLEERLSAVISNMAGATAEQLHAALGMPQGDEGLESALAQMQLDGAIYIAGDRYMPL